MLPGQLTMRILNADLREDQAELAQRYADQPLRPAKPQLPADHGLFSDEANQLDLIEMFMD